MKVKLQIKNKYNLMKINDQYIVHQNLFNRHNFLIISTTLLCNNSKDYSKMKEH